MYKLGAIGIMAILVASAPPNASQGYRSLDLRPAIAVISGAGRAAAAKERDWEWKGRVDRGDAIEIKGVNGEIHAERGSGNEVEVRARLKGKKSDPNTVEMVVVEHDDGVTICAVYPSGDDDRQNECRPGSGGRMNVKSNDVTVEFTVSVPAGVNFIGRTVNGGVEASGIEGDVKAYTVNGGIDIFATGLAEANTVNGSIAISMERADWDGTLEFSTVNGGVTLELPADLSGDVDVSTVNGRISIDFPLTIEGRISPRHLKGTIGDGGRSLVIKTVNGSIEIRRS